MDLHTDVKKATSLPSANNAKFFRLTSSSQAEKDRKMNEKKVKTPQNLILLEDNTDNSTRENDINNEIKPAFDKHGISAAIKEINGGLDLSNKHWESFWAKHLQDMNNVEIKESHKSCSHKDTEAKSEDQYEIKNSEHHQLIKREDKIFRNAAFMGLVNTKQISLEDLVSSSNKNCTKNENRLKTLDTQIDDNYQVMSIPLCEDPEIYIHPLRMGIDIKMFKDIDFTVPRVGKKIKETPQQYFLRTTNDDSFKFVKKTRTQSK
ncbi:uncharacterized protein LOC105190599 [Harpegnathos saltator]|uniref:uncharacterized protein LOC105190599 n=1 Tax=Harpegnathos saltator TaxID=610380 RepID=UPI00058B4F2E|nr:uncharacterized protein LOC105190599 [Harpegnathos saltator]